jgi:hypothetical protein
MARRIQTSAAPECSEELATLLEAFQVTDLGDGCASTGVSQLAAMAIVLSNLARPESGIITPDGRFFEIGCNVLTTGPQVSSAVLDSVVKPVDRCQNTLLAQLDRLLKEDIAEEARGVNRRWTLTRDQLPTGGEGALLQLMSGDPQIAPLVGDTSDQWLQVLMDGPTARFGDLIRCPRAFIAAPSPGYLEKQLRGAHLGQALVAISLNRPAEALGFGSLCPALIDGLIPAGPSGTTVCGKLLVTDISGVFQELIKSTNDKSAWMGRLLWLGEGSAGPDLPPPSGNPNIVRLPKVAARFEHAVLLLFANRLNSYRPEPLIDEINFAPLQAQWMGFLSDMEPTLPGITAVARRLLASLIFGLCQLARATPKPEGFKIRREGVAALGRFLVRRMANHRAAILFTAEDARRQRHMRRILEKLADGGLTTRGIYHPLHLEADTCRELLANMEADQLVRRNGSLWERIECVPLQADQSGYLQLEL